MSLTVGELKDLLLRFSWERRDWPREDVQRQSSALVPAKRGLDAWQPGIRHKG